MPKADNGVRIITVHTFSRVLEWYDTAINTPAVSRYLTTGGFTAMPALSEIDRGDWSNLYAMDRQGLGLLHVSFDRDGYRPELSLALFTLDFDKPHGKLAAGRLIRFGMTTLQQKYNARRISAIVHSTNAPSLALMNKHFGPPWGISPRSCVDNLIGDYVDAHRFAKLYED